MKAPRDSYVRRMDGRDGLRKRKGTTKRCSECGKRKSIREGFHRHSSKPDGYRNDCKTCRRKRYIKRERTKLSFCSDCGVETEGRVYCETHRAIRQALKERAFEESPPPSPAVCGLSQYGKTCPEVVADTCDREGRGVIYCPKHGYRLAPVIRPENFRRYDQRDRLDDEVERHVEKACSEVDPVISERNAGSGKRSKNFVVGHAHGKTYVEHLTKGAA